MSATSSTSTRFTAVSNLSWNGRTPSAGHPADESSFPTQAQARAWLRSLKCGGSISTHTGRDFELIEEVQPG